MLTTKTAAELQEMRTALNGALTVPGADVERIRRHLAMVDEEIARRAKP